MTIEGDDNYPFRTYPENDPYYDTHDECTECCEWYEIKIMKEIIVLGDNMRICPDCYEEEEEEEEESDDEESKNLKTNSSPSQDPQQSSKMDLIPPKK